MAVEGFLVLLAVAFVPPLVFLLWVRSLERRGREPLGAVLRVFVAGSVLGVLVALALSLLLDSQLRRPYEALASAVPYAVFAAVAVAPLAEEPAKLLCVLLARDRAPEPEDGLVYGAAAGLGFAATENLLYEGIALATDGLAGYAATVVLRSVSATLLHASASAWAGYALLRARTGGAPAWIAVAGLAGAVLLHAVYNLLASVGIVLALALAVVVALAAFRAVRRRVAALDAAGAA